MLLLQLQVLSLTCASGQEESPSVVRVADDAAAVRTVPAVFKGDFAAAALVAPLSNPPFNIGCA